MILALFLAAAVPLTPQSVETAFAGRVGAYVQIDCSSGDTFRNDDPSCAAKFAPCSTFKIWNSAIGLELGTVSAPDAPFWKWDGVERTVSAAWNQDQTLRSAFAASCVPAYQKLARDIGADRMKEWIAKIGYGDGDISAGLDVFWLPEEGRRTILISAQEQAELIVRLVTAKLPFSEKTQAILKDVMKVKSTDAGTLYGKTGTAGNAQGQAVYGWFVGYVESKGRTVAFACRIEGIGVMGKDARTATEAILTSQGLL